MSVTEKQVDGNHRNLKDKVFNITYRALKLHKHGPVCSIILAEEPRQESIEASYNDSSSDSFVSAESGRYDDRRQDDFDNVTCNDTHLKLQLHGCPNLTSVSHINNGVNQAQPTVIEAVEEFKTEAPKRKFEDLGITLDG